MSLPARVLSQLVAALRTDATRRCATDKRTAPRVGFRHPIARGTLAYRLLGAPYALGPAATLARGLQPVGPSSDPLTDDRAPVEWKTDGMIIQYVSAH